MGGDRWHRPNLETQTVPGAEIRGTWFPKSTPHHGQTHHHSATSRFTEAPLASPNPVTLWPWARRAPQAPNHTRRAEAHGRAVGFRAAERFGFGSLRGIGGRWFLPLHPARKGMVGIWWDVGHGGCDEDDPC